MNTIGVWKINKTRDKVEDVGVSIPVLRSRKQRFRHGATLSQSKIVSKLTLALTPHKSRSKSNFTALSLFSSVADSIRLIAASGAHFGQLTTLFRWLPKYIDPLGLLYYLLPLFN